jgi:hypothetical protein
MGRGTTYGDALKREEVTLNLVRSEEIACRMVFSLRGNVKQDLLLDAPKTLFCGLFHKEAIRYAFKLITAR